MEGKENLMMSKNEKTLEKIEKGLILFWILIYSVGALGITQDLSRQFFLPLTPWNLLFSGLSIIILKIFDLNQKHIPKALILLITMGFIGFISESIGVGTGIFFGNYYYTSRLGLPFLGVPLLLFINWITVPMINFELVSRFLRNKPIWIKILISAIMMVIFDFFLEKFAIKYGLWVWKSSKVPMLNYITWFILGIITTFLYSKVVYEKERYLGYSLWILQFLFFLLTT